MGRSVWRRSGAITSNLGRRHRFDYRADGLRRIQEVRDPELAPIVRGTLKRRRDDGAELLAYRNGTGWRDVRSEDVNAYVKELAGRYSAKDFRTWHGTVFAAVALTVAGEVPGAGSSPPRMPTR